jgi:O-antigen/teichoic acid export membrane protein
LGTGIGIAGGILTTAFAVRLLSLENYGYLAFLMSAVATATAFISVFTMNGVTRETSSQISKDPARLRELGRGAVAISALGGVMIFVILVAIAESRSGLSADSRLAAGLGLGMMAFATTHGILASAIARGLRRFALMEVPPLLVVLGRLTVIVSLTIAGRADLTAVLVGYGIVGLICLVLSQIVISRIAGGKRGWLRPSFAAGKRLVTLTYPYALAGLGVLVIAWADVLVLGFVRPATEVARYEPVLRITDRMMLVVPNLFAGSFLPVATGLFERGTREAFNALYRLISRYVYALSMPFLILLIAFPETIIRTMYGASFPGRPILVWVLLFGYVINLITGMNYLAIGATGDRVAIVRPAAIAAGVMILLAVGLIIPFGPLGAAYATSLSFLVLNVLVSVALYRKTGAHPFDARFLRVITTSFLPVAGAIFLREHGLGSDFWAALGISGAAWAAWMLLLAALGWLDIELFRRLPGIAGK